MVGRITLHFGYGKRIGARRLRRFNVALVKMRKHFGGSSYIGVEAA
jgi:hypothetical protein